MNTYRIRLWLSLTSTSFVLVAPSMAASPAVKGAAPAAGGITIINSGDAYVPGYRITVGPNGELRAASFPRNGGPTIRRRDQMTTEIHRRFLADLAKAAPVNALSTGAVAPAGRQGRRVQVTLPRQVYGAQVYVIYQTRTSPNLRMASSAAGKTLYQDVKQIMSVLRLPVPNVP